MAVVMDISMSLDGFVAGPNQSVDDPLGEGGMELHQWAFKLASWRDPHGKEGGETTIDDEVMAESVARRGATVIGRNMFGGGPGPWGDDPWNGWWGDDPPYHHPVFVVTNHAREPLTLADTTFTFVTEGVAAAVEQATAAAGDKDVLVAGGADVAGQCLAAGLLDEMEIHVIPVLLGGGARLFHHVDGLMKLDKTRVIDSDGVTHVRYENLR
jgi:dihydrofolate reductase